MATITKDITVTQGTTHTEIFTLETVTNPTLPWDASTNPYIPLDLSTASIALMSRPTYNSSIVSYTATTVNGAITITNSAAGEFKLVIGANDLNAIKFNSPSINYPYNMLVTFSPTNVIEVCAGDLIINRGITRAA